MVDKGIQAVTIEALFEKRKKEVVDADETYKMSKLISILEKSFRRFDFLDE